MTGGPVGPRGISRREGSHVRHRRLSSQLISFRIKDTGPGLLCHTADRGRWGAKGETWNGR